MLHADVTTSTSVVPDAQFPKEFVCGLVSPLIKREAWIDVPDIDTCRRPQGLEELVSDGRTGGLRDVLKQPEVLWAISMRFKKWIEASRKEGGYWHAIILRSGQG